MWLEGIQTDGATVCCSRHRHAHESAVRIVIFIVKLVNLFWKHGPGHQYPTRTIVVQRCKCDNWRCHRISLWQGDRVGLFKTSTLIKPHLTSAGSIALNMPSEFHILAKQFLRKHPYGRQAKGSTVGVASHINWLPVVWVKPCNTCCVA